MQASGSAAADAVAGPVRVAGTVSLRWLAVVVPLAIYFVLAAITFASAWRDPLAYQVGNPGDPQEYMWFWAWTPYALGHALNPFFSTYIDYPAGVNLLWNPSMPLIGLLVWPVTSSLGLPFALNLAATGALALSAWTAFLLFRRMVTSTVAAAAGGLLYGFSPYMLAESMAHVQMTLVFLPPLILLLLDEIVRVRRHRPAIVATLLAVTCAAQFLISEEVLVGTGITVVILLVLAAALWPQHVRASLRSALPPLLLALGLFLTLLAYPLYFQLLGPQTIRGLIHERGVYVTDALNFFVPTRVQQFAPQRAIDLTERFTGGISEWTGYVGIPLALLLLLVAVRHWSSGWVRLASLGAAVVALLSMGSYLHVGGVVHQHLPVFALALVSLLLLRWLPGHVVVLLAFGGWLALDTVDLLGHVIPTRLMVWFFLLAGAGLAVFLDSKIKAGGARALLGVAAVIVALVPLVPREPFMTTRVDVPAFFTGPAEARIPDRSVALVFPMAGFGRADAMQWQAAAHMRFQMPEGYAVIPPQRGQSVASSESPPSKMLEVERRIEGGEAPPIGDEVVRAEIESELSEWRVQTVVVGPMPHEDRAVAFLAWMLGRSPTHEEGVYLWSDVHT